jgi:hypothetical protein
MTPAEYDARRLQRARHYYDIPDENTAVILTADFFRRIKSLPVFLARISLETLRTTYARLVVPDAVLPLACGNVFHPVDRLILAWIERNAVRITSTRVGKLLMRGEISWEAAMELSVEEAADLCPVGAKTYRIGSDGGAMFHFRTVETSDIVLSAPPIQKCLPPAGDESGKPPYLTYFNGQTRRAQHRPSLPARIDTYQPAV